MPWKLILVYKGTITCIDEPVRPCNKTVVSNLTKEEAEKFLPEMDEKGVFRVGLVHQEKAKIVLPGYDTYEFWLVKSYVKFMNDVREDLAKEFDLKI